jgi:uncharacterized repeat protein (TIGR02543 family)
VVKENDVVIIDTTFMKFKVDYLKDTVWCSYTFSTPGVKNLTLTPYSTPGLQPVSSNISIIEGPAIISTITFLKNSSASSGTMPILSYTEGDSVRLIENSFVNSGYSFSGWAITETGPVELRDKAEFKMGTENITLYAVWVNDSAFTITFNRNHASAVGLMNAQSIISGRAVSLNPNEFTNTGWTFAGWATTATGTVAYTDKAEFTMENSNDTLYAVWTQKPSYKVTFNSNGGTGSMADQSITSGMSAALTANAFAKPSWIFAGWAPSTAGTVIYSDKAEYAMKTGNDTLYAIWTQNPLYNIFFNSNGGTGSMSGQSIASGMSVPLSANAYIKTGFKFSGWNTVSNGSGTPYVNGTSFTMNTSDVVLYAQWIIARYTITFNSLGGSAVSTQTIEHGGKVIEPAAPTRANYLFNGWYNEAGCVNAWNFATMTVSNDDTLFAKWDPNSSTTTYTVTYTVTYDGQGATTAPIPASQTVTSPATTVGTLPAQPQKTGYSFGGWYTAISGGGAQFTVTTIVTANDTVYAKWTQNVSFALTISATNGSVTRVPDLTAYDSGTVVTLTPIPTNDYHFTGWNGALTGVANPGAITMNEAKSVTANFEKNTASSFTITVLATNGTVKKTPDLPQYDSGTIVGLKATANAGYKFGNWTGDATGTSDSTTVTMTATKNVTANFTINTYVLTMTNDGNGTTNPTTGTTMVNQGDATPLTAAPSAGYVFSSWTVTTGTATVANPASAATTVTLSTDATIKASFSPITYLLTISNDGNGTTNPISPATVNYGVATDISATPATGYQFVSWTVTTGAVNATIVNANSASTKVTLTGNATIKANFTALPLTLTMSNDGNGTTTPTSSATAYYGVATDISASPATGYQFASWTVTTGAGNATLVNANSASTKVSLTGNATIKANFTALHLTLTMTNDGYGTTTPASSTTVSHGVATDISAIPATGYHFSNWTVTSTGTVSATFVNANSASTKVTLTGNATIKANFTISAPVIITGLQNQSCSVNETVTFTIVAQSPTLSYAWKKNGNPVGTDLAS